MNSTMTVEDIINTSAIDATPGFMEAIDTPSMTTPATFYAAQYAVVGSTLCLVC